MAELFIVLEKPEGFLATMPAPRSGMWLDGDLRWLKRKGVDVVVSLLQNHEIQMLGLESEAALCEKHGMRYVSFPILDHNVPKSAMKVGELCRELHAGIERGESVAFHCLAGIGRSSVMAACVMLLDGIHYEEAFRRIGEARGLPVPDVDAQRLWVKENRVNLVGRPR